MQTTRGAAESRPATTPGPAGGRPTHFSSPLLVRQLLPGILLAVVGIRQIRGISDEDTFWHIRAGHQLRETWTFSGPDPWNTLATEPWTLHEWLPELVMSLAHDLGGLPGVTVLFVAASVGLILTFWILARAWAPILIAAAVTVAGYLGVAGSLSQRPHLVSFALAALFTATWMRSGDDGRPRWWLIPLTWVWAMSHGLWPVAVVIGFAGASGALLQAGRAWRQHVRLLLVPVGGIAAAALTPVGPTLLSTPFAVQGATHLVTEWAPLGLFHPSLFSVVLLLGATVVVWARSSTPPAWADLLLAGAALCAALAYGRTVAVGAAIAVPVAARALARGMPFVRESVTRREVLLVGGLAALPVLLAAAVAPAVAAAPVGFPTGLSARMADLPGGTVVCNHYRLGGWLLWSQPQLTLAVDGRSELYAVSHVEEHQRWEAGQPGWQDYVARTDCSVAVMPTGSAAAVYLREELGWAVAAEDQGYELLREPRSS